MVRCLHQAGMDVVIHCFQSGTEAKRLAAELNARVPGSAVVLRQDLRQEDKCRELLQEAARLKPRLDAVVHNASVFKPSALAEYQCSDWSELAQMHLQAPMALARHAAPMLRATSGCMVYLTDIYARHPRASHSLYCASKAGLDMLVRCLARQLAPDIRVNAVAPGAILWAEHDGTSEDQESIKGSIPLGRMGEPRQIAAAVRFLIQQASYMTGATIAVDGGRSLNLP